MAALLHEIGKAQMLLRIMEDIALARRVQFRIGDVDHDVNIEPGENNLLVECEAQVEGEVIWVVIDGTLRYCIEQKVIPGAAVQWHLHLASAA